MSDDISNSEDDFEMDAVDKMLSAMSDDAGSQITSCTYKTCFEKFGELRQKAKQESRVAYYIHGTFFQMDQAQYLLDYSTMRERAIELVSLLGDYEQLLKIEPDASVDYYEYIVYEMRPCAFENLAEATGAMEGYNSDGLHDCIAEGLQVCRSVGKIGCINCFREYACDVYLAADDFELARHQCQTVVEHEGEWQGRGNRRWLAKNRMAWANLLSGNMEAAMVDYDQALEFTNEEDVSLPLEAKFKVLVEQDMTRILRGEAPALPQHEIFSKLPARDECPLFDLRQDWNAALQATVAKDFDAADKILREWDGRLRECRGSHFWFENRLRQIAMKRLAGDANAVESLSATVEERAKEANDWLTIRRLNEIVGSDQDPEPIGVAAFRSSGSAPLAASEGPMLHTGEAAAPPDLGAEAEQRLSRYSEQFQEAAASEDPSKLEQVAQAAVEELLGLTADQCENFSDTVSYLGMMDTALSITQGARGPEIWKWANRLAAPYQKMGHIVSMLGTLGATVASFSPDPENPIVTEDRLRQLFKTSLGLQHAGPNTFGRAGDFYVSVGDMGEAERCYARAFKLDRSNGQIATQLAEVYVETERPRDALHVLDLCLREGTDFPGVAYRAAMQALDLNQNEAALTYLERFVEYEEVSEISPLPFLRALALLRMGQAESALVQIELEEQLFGRSDGFHCLAQRAWACSELGRLEEASSFFEAAMQIDFSTIDYLRPFDVIHLLRVMFEKSQAFEVSRAAQQTMLKRLLVLGEMPDDFFQAQREETPQQNDIQFYLVVLSQEIAGVEQSTNFLPGMEQWDHYLAEWGVLAENEEDAAELASQAQSQCCEGMIRVLDIQHQAGPFEDSPGVTFQGARRFIPLEFMNFDGEPET